ncbi:complement C1q-like protein 4 [Saccostrea echinata]|uniref:complement C1q-like protein 4 n=1 Tax=Saccostrea echinata TaxID=191078 RepID=UPI002A84149E|nr:complement C1q-like protein 4 [Saccostrea echinata]
MANKDRAELTPKISALEAKIRRSDYRQGKLEKTINRLKKIILDLKLKTLTENVDIDSISEGGYRKTSTEKTKQTVIFQTLKDYSDVPRSQKKRILTGGGAVPSAHVVAFYAYMSANEPNPGKHHTVIFNTVITNVGSSYNHHDGVFTAPTNGVYVFSWNLYSQFHGLIASELMVNSASKGGRLSDSRSVSEDHSSSGTLVVEISQGDIVYIRTHQTLSISGNINSYPSSYQSSFCGWLLI